MIDHEKIRIQAKEILDKFAQALEGIKTDESKVEREKNRRAEGKEKLAIDRKIMFKNAPRTKDNFIEAEKGSWV